MFEEHIEENYCGYSKGKKKKSSTFQEWIEDQNFQKQFSKA